MGGWKAQLEERISSQKKSPFWKIICLCASNNPTPPVNPSLSPPPGWRLEEAGRLLTNTLLFLKQVRALPMNYSHASISSVEAPDKSQALKWISRLTCLHRAGRPVRLPAYLPTERPSPQLPLHPPSPLPTPLFTLPWLEINA